MSHFNFDAEFFRRVISKCDKTEKLPLLSQMVKEAVDVFYNEFDYYPEMAVFAPGSFTIMGDHLEYVKGNLVQAGLPMLTVVVGKPLCSVKCRLTTTSRDVQGLRKSIFPIYHYKKNMKVFPEWVNYVKGAINSFPSDEIKGFDAVIHSNVPVCQGYGSSASLQVGIYTFLEAAIGRKSCEKMEEKGSLCQLAERPVHLSQYKMGQWNNFTAAVAVENAAVKINCRSRTVSTFDIRDIDILFLLTYPKFEIELNDRDLVPRREMELMLIGALLGLEDIIDATDQDLDVLANMEDPTRETVENILRGFGYKEEVIMEYVDGLFTFPVSEAASDLELYAEGELFGSDIPSQSDVEAGKESFLGEEILQKIEKEEEPAEKPCCLKAPEKRFQPAPKAPPVSYIQQRIAELCEGKAGSHTSLPKRICEEINCLGGIENLSVASDMTVCGRLLRRLRHIYTENVRSQELTDILSHLDYEEFGTKLIQSHLSLKLDYEVSCPTLDGLVQVAIETDRVYGAKMTSGGGTLTLLHRSVVETYIDKVTEKYGENFWFYLVFPSSGAKIVSIGPKRNPKSSLSHTFPTVDQLLKNSIENFLMTYQYYPTHGAFSPGSVNLIGDHPDYNNGSYISMAVNMSTVVVGAFNGTSKIRACTTANVDDKKRHVIFPLPLLMDMTAGTTKWENIIRGAVVNFKGELKGFDCLIESSVPCRSGIGSKSALTVAFYTFLEELTGIRTKKSLEKALKCKKAVQEFSKIVYNQSTFIMPVRAKKDTVGLVDCRSAAVTFMPFFDPSVIILITLTTSVPESKKSILSDRKDECFSVAKALGGKTLRCLSLKDLDVLKGSKVPERSILRAQHVIKENARVLRAAEALKNNDYEALGELMVQSHNSLRDEYEVSRPELDQLVTLAMEVDGVFGSKMCCSESLCHTISLVKRWAVDDLIEYQQKNFAGPLTFYIVGPHARCGSLGVKEYVDAQLHSRFIFEDIFPF